MKNRIILFLSAITLLAIGCTSCKSPKTAGDITISPESGTTYKSGQAVPVKVSLSADSKVDSIVYLVDSVRVGSKKDTTAFSFKTDSMRLGARVVTAKLFMGGQQQDISTNIVLLAAKAPEIITYTVEKVFPHDTSSYTEGLLYHDGYLYESTGNEGHSTLRKVDLATGKAVQIAKIPAKYFGEGSMIIGNKILMLTYKQPEAAFLFDKDNFKLDSTFINNVGVEGWGLAFDGNKLYLDDSTNRIWFLDKDNFREIGYIDVYDDKTKIDSVNELEYIHGKLYSNIYQKEDIIVIDPKTGAVLQKADMSKLWPKSQRPANFDNDQNVLNGIAWDEKGQRMFVTGKKWPHLYQIKLSKKP